MYRGEPPPVYFNRSFGMAKLDAEPTLMSSGEVYYDLATSSIELHEFDSLVNRMRGGSDRSSFGWEWQDDVGSWIPYDSASSAKLEEHYSYDDRTAVIQVSGRSYNIDFSAMQQTNPSTAMARGVRRVAFAWEYQDDNGAWQPYDGSAAATLEHEYSNGASSASLGGVHGWVVTLTAPMQQSNTTSTGKTRAVRRHLLSSSSDGAGSNPPVTQALLAGSAVPAINTPVATAVAAPAVVQGVWLKPDTTVTTQDGQPTFIAAAAKKRGTNANEQKDNCQLTFLFHAHDSHVCVQATSDQQSVGRRCLRVQLTRLRLLSHLY